MLDVKVGNHVITFNNLVGSEKKHILNLVDEVLGDKEMTNVNELNTVNSGFDADETKLTDLQALDLVLQKPDVRASFLKQIELLVRAKTEIVRQQENYKDIVKSTKDAYRFKTTSLISKAVDAVVKDILEDEIAIANAESDLFTIIQEYVQGE